MSADYSDQEPEPRPAADAIDLFQAPDNFFGRLTGLMASDSNTLDDGIRRTTRTWGPQPPDWERLAVWDRVQSYERRLQERQIEGEEESLDDAHYRWAHPNLFAPQDHTGDTRKIMKQIDVAITEWIEIVFPDGPPSWNELRHSDKDWLMIWVPRARLWLETEREFGYRDLLRAWGEFSPSLLFVTLVRWFANLLVWRILWEQLFSPDAPADKWNGEDWVNYSKFQKVWEGRLYLISLCIHLV